MIAIRSGWKEPLEADVPARRQRVDTRVLADQLLSFAEQGHATLYAVLDAARTDQVVEMLVDGELPHETLYRGGAHEKHIAVSPFLVQLAAGSKVFDKLAGVGWGQSWGIFLTSPEPFEVVVEHLRRFVFATTENEDGDEVVFFRFYDPRVLRAYLPTCTSSELGLLLGPVSAVFAESEIGDAILTFNPSERPVDAAAGDETQPTTQKVPAGTDAPLLRVRREQVAVLAHYLSMQFETRAMRHLRLRFRKATGRLDAAELRALVRQGIAQAEQYDIRIRSDLLYYLECTFRFGRAFDTEQPWAKQILQDPTTPGLLKMDRIREHEQAAADPRAGYTIR